MYVYVCVNIKMVKSIAACVFERTNRRWTYNKQTNKQMFCGGPLYFFSNASYYYYICRKWNSSLNAGPPAITYTYTRLEEYYAFVALMMTTMTMMMLVTEMALAHLLPTYSFTYRLLCHYKPCIFMAGDWYKELKK